MREAARALKGSILRQEVYADDGTPKASLPYSVSERSYRLTCLQPQGPNRHAVFFSHPSETLDYHYERNPADPRISHALTLAGDDYGNVLKSAAIGYARRIPQFDEQAKTLATLTESRSTNPVLEADAYRAPLPAEVKTYELTAPSLAGAKPLGFAAVDAIAVAATEISYEVQPTSGLTQKRLIEQLRTIYRKNDLAAALPSGSVESMALPGETFLGRPRAAPINRHSPDSGQFLGQSHPLDRLGQRQIGFVVGKRRSKPAVDGTATLIRAVLPESRHASPLVARAFDLPGSSCRRGWCSQPGDQGQDFGEHLSRDCDLGHLEGHVAAMTDHGR